jgi:hypothetical protein
LFAIPSTRLYHHCSTLQASVIAGFDRGTIGSIDTTVGLTAEAELRALKVWLHEPVFVARLLRRLLANDPDLQAMACQILHAIKETGAFSEGDLRAG